MRHSSRQTLELVVERARRLASSPLAKDPVDLEIRWTPDGAPRVIGGQQHPIEAALRIVRQFLEPAEAISFSALGERFRGDEELSPSFARDLERLVRELAVQLDQAPALRFKIRGQSPPTTPREILDAVLHGRLEQLDPARRETLARWLAQPVSALLVRAQLQSALAAVGTAIQRLRGLCERELLRSAE
jgi:hypothetical protein